VLLKAFSRSRAAMSIVGSSIFADNKERNSDSAEYLIGVRLSEEPSLYEQRREAEGQVNGCTFFGSFLYASKEMNNKNKKSGGPVRPATFTIFIYPITAAGS
jgi:hypothetical protein